MPLHRYGLYKFRQVLLSANGLNASELGSRQLSYWIFALTYQRGEMKVLAQRIMLGAVMDFQVMRA
jgi:hypothetical protein